MDVFLLLGLTILNGLFAMSEVALLTARRLRLSKLAEEGDKGAAAAIALGEHPTRFLSVIQIGITLIIMLNGIVGESKLAPPVEAWLISNGLTERYAHVLATGFVVIAITYVSIVIGELVPKRLGQMHPEAVARIAARPMQILSLISRPFVRLLTVSTEAMLRLFGLRQKQDQTVTEEEIHAMLEEGSEAGIIEKKEHEMVRNVFRLDERAISSFMIPRADIVALDVEEPIKTNLQRMIDSDHSRFPVCRGGLDDILGVIATKQLLAQSLRGDSLSLSETQLSPPVFVPESLTGMELLEQFRASSSHMAFVVDEYGEVLGIVTLQDVLETVTGEFQSESDEDAWAIERADGSWLLDGLIPIPELKDHLELKTVPEEEKERYQTLSGMMMWLLGRLPKTGDIANWEGWQLEVVDMDGKRIDKILATYTASGDEIVEENAGIA